jgi:hypothetical protein
MNLFLYLSKDAVGHRAARDSEVRHATNDAIRFLLLFAPPRVILAYDVAGLEKTNKK